MDAILLAAGADVNAKDSHGVTPLALAVEQKNQESIKLLRKHKAKE